MESGIVVAASLGMSTSILLTSAFSSDRLEGDLVHGGFKILKYGYGSDTD